MTAKQGKVLLICGGVLAASYVARSVVLGVMQARYIHEQQVRAAQRKAKADADAKTKAAAKAKEAEKAPAATPSAPSPPPVPEIFGQLPRIWNGRAALTGRGLCNMKLELSSSEPSKFQGVTSISCLAVPALMSKADRQNPKTGLLSRLTPDVAMLAGNVKEGALQLTTDKAVGGDIHGCAIATLALTPLTNTQLAAEWQGNGCEGGRMVLGRPSHERHSRP
jgi:hypothetical protein